MIDAFNGFKEGFASSGGSIIGGVLGAISGIYKGIIGMPLDLLKDLVSWIASKLGFENFSAILDSFSFTDMIGSLFNTITDSLLGVFDAMKDETGKFDFGKMVKVIVGGLVNAITAPIRAMINGIAFLLDKIPLGIAKSGASALRKMSSAMTIDTGVGDAVSARKEKRAELEASKEKETEIKPNPPVSANAVKDATQEEKIANEGKQMSGAIAQQIINAPTNTNNNSNQVHHGSAEGAIDPTDGMSGRKEAYSA
jgi:hypothetical protein